MGQEMAWSPWDHVEPALVPVEEKAERLERIVRQSVQGWAAAAGRVVLGVSGGLDSSIVAACLAGPSRATTCVTLFTRDPAGDERDYARILCASLGLRLVELIVWYAAALGVGFAIEARLGQIQRQGWEFYVAMASLFLTWAFPGFVWRYLRRGA
jgi:asparagine synthase (glutamine-hydrolysing)